MQTKASMGHLHVLEDEGEIKQLGCRMKPNQGREEPAIQMRRLPPHDRIRHGAV